MIGMWERGERTPSGSTLMKIAAEFDVVVKITNGSFFILENDEYILSEQDVRKDAEQHKSSMPSMFFGSYQLPDGNWQGVLASDDEQEITEILTYHAQGRPWFVV
jgi:transcriptional regulator with XRE-family HTH domain